MNKLDNQLETNQIKQTGNKRELILFRDSAIEKIKKTNIDFKGNRIFFANQRAFFQEPIHY